MLEHRNSDRAPAKICSTLCWSGCFCGILICYMVLFMQAASQRMPLRRDRSMTGRSGMKRIGLFALAAGWRSGWLRAPPIRMPIQSLGRDREVAGFTNRPALGLSTKTGHSSTSTATPVGRQQEDHRAVQRQMMFHGSVDDDTINGWFNGASLGSWTARRIQRFAEVVVARIVFVDIRPPPFFPAGLCLARDSVSI